MNGKDNNGVTKTFEAIIPDGPDGASPRSTLNPRPRVIFISFFHAWARCVINYQDMKKAPDATVSKDYQDLAKVGAQYYDDAEALAEITTGSSTMSREVLAMMQEINSSIESIAATVTQSAAGAGEIANVSQQTNEAVTEVSELAGSLADAAQELLQMVEQFRLK